MLKNFLSGNSLPSGCNHLPYFLEKKLYFVSKIVLTYGEKNGSINRKKFCKLKDKGRSIFETTRTVKGQNNF